MTNHKEYLPEEIQEKIEEIGFNVNPERGERSEFLKITITMSHDMLQAIKMFGVEKKSQRKKDCDVSSIIRESVAYYLLNWSEDYKKKILKKILNNEMSQDSNERNR